MSLYENSLVNIICFVNREVNVVLIKLLTKLNSAEVEFCKQLLIIFHEGFETTARQI